MTTNEHEIITCECCGEIIEDESMAYTTHDGDWVCEVCKERYYSGCEECGELFNVDDLHCVDDSEWVCEDCLENSDNYFRCDDCQEYHRSYDRWGRRRYNNRSGGGVICDDCYENGDYYYCEDCGDAMSGDDVTEIDDEYYCPNCAVRKQRRIHDYGYKPDPQFKSIHDVFFDRIDTGNLYFGVELEVDDGNCRDDCAGDLVDASEDIYCKTDGSLHRGIEIVTHPCTLQYHTEVLPWAQLSRIARDYDFKSHDTTTCGLHVHVGREEMGRNSEEQDETAAKIVMLVVRHWDNLVKFSRRRESELDEWAMKPRFEYAEDDVESIRNALETEYRGRYQAVNLKNEYTVEFRLFKGTLKRDTIIATLQLVNNIVNYAKNHQVDDVMKSQWEDVARYEQFKELDAYLEERDLRQVAEIEPAKYYTPVKIEEGDLVEVALTSADDRILRGLYGRVVVAEEDNPCVGVDFGITLSMLHNLSGRLPRSTGYWMLRRYLRIVQKGEKKECA